MKVYVLQHAEPETPGMIGVTLQARGAVEERVRTFAGERVPASMEGASGLVVMGGPMGVYEQERYPHLREEIRLIQDAVGRGKPVLGVCLGSQLLAAALGAKVAPAPRREIGWHSITLREDAASDPLWRGIDRTFVAFHWHGDAFELPAGAVPLASSRATLHQAFRHGESAYGFLFHMEMDESMVRAMVEAFRGEMPEAGEDPAAVLARARDGVRDMGRIAGTVFGRWIALLEEA